MEKPHFTAKTTDQTSKLKQLIRPVEDVISEVMIEVTEDAVELNAADPAMVGLAHFKIKNPEEFFDEFEVNQEFKTGINIENFYKMLKKSTNDHTVTWSYGEGDKKELWMLENEFEEGFNVRKSFKKLNLSEDDIPGTKELDFKNRFEVETDKLNTMLNYFNNFCNAITLTNTEEGLEIEGSIEDKYDDSEMTAQLDTDNEHIRYEEFEDEVRSMFSIDYLETQLTGNTLPSLAERVDIAMGTDFPMEISYEDENFVYVFVLAPRIEEDN